MYKYRLIQLQKKHFQATWRTADGLWSMIFGRCYSLPELSIRMEVCRAARRQKGSEKRVERWNRVNNFSISLKFAICNQCQLAAPNNHETVKAVISVSEMLQTWESHAVTFRQSKYLSLLGFQLIICFHQEGAIYSACMNFFVE